MQLNRYLAVSQASDLESFRKELVRAGNDLGFGLFSCSLVHPREDTADIYYTGNIPEGYEESFLDQEDSSLCPVVQRMKTLTVPFFYDQELYVKSGLGGLWEAQAAWGYHSGIAMAMRLPKGRFWWVGMDTDRPLPSSIENRNSLLSTLQQLAVHAHAAGTRLLVPEQEPLVDVCLSEREKEILRWTNEGKSNWIIGQILNISDATVKYHVRNICKKLDAVTKQDALVKAGLSGFPCVRR